MGVINIKTRILIFLIILSASLQLSGCSLNSSAAATPEILPAELELSGSVTILNKSNNEPGKNIEKFLSSYFIEYFESLAFLESRDISAFYDKNVPAGAESGILNQKSLEYLINLRKLQNNDLSLKEYKFRGEITFFDKLDVDLDNLSFPLYKLELMEYNTLNFAFIPEVESHTSGIDHHFLLRLNDDGEFKIISHQRFEDVNYLLEDLYRQEREKLEKKAETLSEPGLEIKIDTGTILDEITKKMLTEAEENLEYRSAGTEIQSPENSIEVPTKLPEADHFYNREAAAAYAMEWVSSSEIKRNPEWLAYDDRGGNCNNFVSQSINAGGIPMDTKGYIESQWKFFDDRINSRQTPWGRSPSWAGVNEFYGYVTKNHGSGMVAVITDDFFAGEIGDVIIYGTEDRWKHAVIITDVIYDADGNIFDYLINSNTTDRIHFPVSAYGYHNTLLIKILGWNE